MKNLQFSALALVLTASQVTFAMGDKEYQEAIREYNKRLAKINEDIKTNSKNREQKEFSKHTKEVLRLEKIIKDDSEQLEVAKDKLTRSKKFLETLDNSPQNINVNEAIKNLCPEIGDKCASAGTSKEELKEALNEYKSCKKYTGGVLFGIPSAIGADGCGNMDKIKRSVGQVKYDSAKEEEKLVAEQARLKKELDLHQDTRKKIFELEKTVSEYDKSGELDKAVASMKFKNQENLFDTKLLLMDVDQLKREYGIAGEDAKDAQDLIDKMAEAASADLDKTIIGSYVSGKIKKALGNICDSVKLCQESSPAIRSDERNSGKDLGEKTSPDSDDADQGASRQ